MSDKQRYRERIWTLLEQNGVARFPGARGRIPNFVGAGAAAESLAGLDEWRSVRAMKSNPDSPQLPVRARALDEGKLVFMAVPRLTERRPFILLVALAAVAMGVLNTKGVFGVPASASTVFNVVSIDPRPATTLIRSPCGIQHKLRAVTVLESGCAFDRSFAFANGVDNLLRVRREAPRPATITHSLRQFAAIRFHGLPVSITNARLPHFAAFFDHE